jgi:hypothetical protein
LREGYVPVNLIPPTVPSATKVPPEDSAVYKDFLEKSAN